MGKINTCARSLYRASLLVTGAVLASVIGAGTAHAQNQEIIVTARKVDENIQDVPISITAITGETFEEAGLTEFADIAQLTPNFDVRPNGATGALFATLQIRGQVGGFLTLNADQAVGINVNGAPITRGTSLFTNLFDIERIEVLKGPQGTLFGKNTTGGVVSVVTRAPELNEFGGYAEFTYGSFERTDAEFVANIPLVDDIAALRLGAALTHRDGFGEGGQGSTFLTGNELADDNEVFLRGSLLIEPTGNVRIRINADYHDVDETGSIFRSLRSAGGGFIALESTNPDIFVGNVFRDEAPFTVAEEYNINATIEIDFDAATLTSITSYRDQNSFTLVQSAPSTAIELGQDADIFGQEVRLSGLTLGERLQWQVGGFYSEEEGIDIDRLPGFFLDTSTFARNETISIFGQATFALTEQVSLTGGIRYTDENREVSSLVFPLANEAEFDGVSWLASVDYRPSDLVLLYASVSRGFRSGAIDQDNIMTVVEPEFVTNYEVGFKADVWDDRIRWNSAFFFSDYTDIQRTAFDPDAPLPVTVLRNAAEATIWGFESELQINPVEGLSFGGTIGYTNGEFDEFLDQDAAGNVIDRSDEPLAEPELQISINGRYERDFSDNLTVGAQANYYYVGEQLLVDPAFAAILGPGEDVVDAYGVLNAQIDFDIRDLGGNLGGLNVALFGTNITDNEYFVGGIVLGLFGGVSNRIVGEPRQWGIRVTKEF
ncbi:TonB-dependent receptor [Erythrobacter ani]|uniref:TonB-dependent receptor n=1 Tax=Erythrobacter ani TaxID=2827235 RepID=A0ABS6SR87_9SPHN|nr:TonB-dependent receptor [Erythrobacter ani]MBV7267528.1 TonB-dependent receptor [Erythrobacter ani]